ncbi:Elongation factor G, mitochondrial [Balamuthia mandrillaris]
MALDLNDNEKEVAVVADFRKPFVGLAFKLEESRFGQLTYMRIYQGQLKKGDTITNTATQKKVKVPRLIRMHSDDMEEINEVGAGEICALFGVECASGTSFTDGTINWSMTSMFIPDPVISLAIHVKDKGQAKNLGKALQRFQREDPTFKVHIDPETNETILSGMGELHLEIYTERMRREYGVDVETGPPRVAYRESLSSKAKFDFTHRKQTGGQGQYARVIGYVEPLDDFDAEELAKEGKRVQFINETIGGSIPPSFIPACEKGVLEAAEKGPLTGHPVQNVRVVINDGNWHPVDSSELAFKTCTINAMRQGMMAANPFLLEPIMSVEVQVPHEFQGTVVGGLNRRKGLILNSSTLTDYVVLEAEVPLSAMVGYATDLRSLTEGKGEFSMEYKRHDAVPRDVQDALAKAYQEERSKTRK